MMLTAYSEVKHVLGNPYYVAANVLDFNFVVSEFES